MTAPNPHPPALGPDRCNYCHLKLLNPRPKRNTATLIETSPETRAYLPCGHWVGHYCYFRRLKKIFYNQGNYVTDCPHGNCINLMHPCGHMAFPTIVQPGDGQLHTVADENLRTRCESCNSIRAVRMRSRVDVFRQLYEAKRRGQLALTAYDDRNR